LGRRKKDYYQDQHGIGLHGPSLLDCTRLGRSLRAALCQETVRIASEVDCAIGLAALTLGEKRKSQSDEHLIIRA